jgi:bifunctional non-homologous end joining protein LigD
MVTARPNGFIQPCIPTRAAKPPSGPGWVHEIKHDGYRLIVRRDGLAVHLFTRRGYEWTDRYPAIAAAAAKLRAKSFTLDGEAVVVGHDGVAVFDALHRRHKASEALLYAFDLLEHDEFNEHTDEDGATVFRHACKIGLEGIVSKRLGAPYRSGLSRDWIKVKAPDSPAMVRHREGRW